MSAARKHDALHVLSDESHRDPDSFAATFLAADRQDGHGQWLRLALLILRDGGVESAVELEAPAERIGTGGEVVDIVFDDFRWQLPRRRQVELIAEKDVFASFDKLFVDDCRPVEVDVP